MIHKIVLLFMLLIMFFCDGLNGFIPLCLSLTFGFIYFKTSWMLLWNWSAYFMNMSVMFSSKTHCSSSWPRPCSHLFYDMHWSLNGKLCALSPDRTWVHNEVILLSSKLNIFLTVYSILRLLFIWRWILNIHIFVR